jgi:hypothetical protein
MVPPIRVEEPSGQRFELALDQFTAGEYFVFRGCGICRRGEFIEVRVPSSWEVENTNEQRARQDLELAERNIRQLQEVSARFSELVGPLPLRFILVYDYGMGGLELCELEDGEFTWRPGYPQHAPAGYQAAEADGRGLQPRGRPCTTQIVVASRAAAA